MGSSSSSRLTAFAWLVCSLGMVFYSYEYLLRISPSVMAMPLREYFGITATGFGTLVGLYYVAYTPMQLVVGAVMDLYGPRKVLTFATAVCAIGSFIFGTTHSIWLAGVGRFLVGFGSAFAFVGALKLAAVWLPVNRFAMFAGLVTALGMVGGMVGDIGMTSLVEHIGWQQTILYGALCGAILIPIIAIVVRDRPAHQPAVKLRHSDVFKEFLKIVRHPQIWLSGLIACMLYLSLSAFAEIWGIPYLRSAFGFSAQQAAWANSTIFWGWLLGGPLAGWISDSLRNRRLPLIVGGFLAAISIAIVLYVPNLPLAGVMAFLFFFGLFSSAEVICFAVGYENAPHEVSGTAVAFVNMLTMLGGVFQAAIGKFLDLAWSGHMKQGIRVYTTHDFQVALTALPIAMVIGALLAFALRKPIDREKVMASKVSV